MGLVLLVRVVLGVFGQALPGQARHGLGAKTYRKDITGHPLVKLCRGKRGMVWEPKLIVKTLRDTLWSSSAGANEA
jgi:hypothetical protein